MENWIKAYLEVMQSCNGMDDESQSQLARRIEKVVKAVENTTGKQVREVKITQRGDVITIIDDERWMHENPWLFEEPNSVAGFNDLNKLQESQALQDAQKEIGKHIQRAHDMQKQAEKAEKETAVKLREADEERQHERKVLKNEINNLRSEVSKKGEKLLKLEKHNAKLMEESVASKETLRKVQAESVARIQKQSQTIENLRDEKRALKKEILDINKSKVNDQAIQAATVESQKERFAAEMKVQQEGYASILQRKCEEIEVLQQAIEEKEIRDTVMAAVDVLCHNVAADLKDVELTGDTGHVNAVSDDTQKVWEICEAPEAEMTTQSEKEGMIVIAVEEKALQGSVQGGSTIAAEEIFETPPLKCGMGETEALDEVDEPVIKCMEKEFDKALDDSAADSDDVDSEYAIHSRPSNVLKHDLRWTDENLKYLKGQSVRWQKVFCFEDQMFVMNLQDGIVYIDPWGVPCDMEQSSLAAFEDLLSNDDSSDEG